MCVCVLSDGCDGGARPFKGTDEKGKRRAGSVGRCRRVIRLEAPKRFCPSARKSPRRGRIMENGERRNKVIPLLATVSFSLFLFSLFVFL